MAKTETFSEKNPPSDPESWPEYTTGGRVRAIRINDSFKFGGDSYDDGYLVRDPDGSVHAESRETFEAKSTYVG